MSARRVIEHALRAYYVDSAEPNGVARDLLTNHRAEVIAEHEAHPGELAMLRGVVGVLRTVVRAGDLAECEGVRELRRLVAEHCTDERAAYAEAEEKTTPQHEREAAVTPQLDDLLARLSDHILGTGGEWTTGTAHRWLMAEVDPGTTRYRARHALQHLAALGHLIERDTKQGRTYTPNYARGGA